MATSRRNNPRYTVKGDYVRGRSKEHRGVVLEIIAKVDKIGNGGKKRPITTNYKIEKFSPKNASDLFVEISEKETVKLSNEKKMDPEILRYDDIYFGKGLDRHGKFVKENVKFCGIVSPSFDGLCQVFI